jgi:long-subunit fatty acid transport protein
MKLRVLATATAGAAVVLASPSAARATNVTEFPDNGSEQMARGGAWVARASDPLATIFNPAGLAGQPTRVTIQNGTIFEHTCFTRVQASSDTTNDPLVSGPGATYPRVCNDISPTINPQLGATIKLGDRLGLGLLVIGPSSGGEKTFPDFIPDGNGQLQAAPNRYLLIQQKGIILFPTIGLGYEVMDNLRIGASFSWGFSRLNLTSATASLNADTTTPASNDTRALIQVKDYFVPAFTLGTLWSATSHIDVAGWYKWSDSIRATGDAGTAAGFYTKANASGDSSKVRYGDTLYDDCGTGVPNAIASKPCGNGSNASLKFAIPMEAKLGFRYHQPRALPVAAPPVATPAPVSPAAPATPDGEGPPAADLTAAPAPAPVPSPELASSHVRDPLATDVFDLEADLTWANNSALDNIQIRFPGDASGKGTLPVAGVAGGEIPPNADQKRGFKDVFGVRVGGDYNVIPDKLALRGGTFFETSAANPQYQNIDFAASSRFGLAAGATYRLRFGQGEKTNALEIMVGYGHVFFAEQSRTDPNASGTNALAGTSCNKANPIPGTQSCDDGSQRYRTKWPVNLGTITNSVNVINVGLAYRF